MLTGLSGNKTTLTLTLTLKKIEKIHYEFWTHFLKSDGHDNITIVFSMVDYPYAIRFDVRNYNVDVTLIYLLVLLHLSSEVMFTFDTQGQLRHSVNPSIATISGPHGNSVCIVSVVFICV